VFDFVSAFSSSGVYPSLADPPGSSVLGAAVAWISGTLLGSAATSIAVIAVASVGYAMLTGRINARYGLTVVLGCFVLSGAAMIASGIQAFRSGGAVSAQAPALPPPQAAPPQTVAPPPVTRTDYDPHAGASVPER
jgi:type IV secretion system protein VirB2